MSIKFKPFYALFQENDYCDNCNTTKKVPVEEVLDLDSCGCCYDNFNYCKECYFNWLYREYVSLNELYDNRGDRNKELWSENERLKKEMEAYNKTFKELSNGKL